MCLSVESSPTHPSNGQSVAEWPAHSPHHTQSVRGGLSHKNKTRKRYYRLYFVFVKDWVVKNIWAPVGYYLSCIARWVGGGRTWATEFDWFFKQSQILEPVWDWQRNKAENNIICSEKSAETRIEAWINQASSAEVLWPFLSLTCKFIVLSLLLSPNKMFEISSDLWRRKFN